MFGFPSFQRSTHAHHDGSAVWLNSFEAQKETTSWPGCGRLGLGVEVKNWGLLGSQQVSAILPGLVPLFHEG